MVWVPLVSQMRYAKCTLNMLRRRAKGISYSLPIKTLLTWSKIPSILSNIPEICGGSKVRIAQEMLDLVMMAVADAAWATTTVAIVA